MGMLRAGRLLVETATLSSERPREGFGAPPHLGSGAPKTVLDLLRELAEAQISQSATPHSGGSGL
jgi:hypothetical protein